MNIQDSIIFFMEILGTIAFAASGAMVGIRKRMDIFGICVLGATGDANMWIAVFADEIGRASV